MLHARSALPRPAWLSVIEFVAAQCGSVLQSSVAARLIFYRLLPQRTMYSREGLQNNEMPCIGTLPCKAHHTFSPDNGMTPGFLQERKERSCMRDQYIAKIPQIKQLFLLQFLSVFVMNFSHEILAMLVLCPVSRLSSFSLFQVRETDSVSRSFKDGASGVTTGGFRTFPLESEE